MKNLASTPISGRGNTFVLFGSWCLKIPRVYPNPPKPQKASKFADVSAQDLLFLHPDFLLISLRCLCNFTHQLARCPCCQRFEAPCQRFEDSVKDQTWGWFLMGNVLKVCQLWEAKALENLLDVCKIIYIVPSKIGFVEEKWERSHNGLQ